MLNSLLRCSGFRRAVVKLHPPSRHFAASLNRFSTAQSQFHLPSNQRVSFYSFQTVRTLSDVRQEQEEDPVAPANVKVPTKGSERKWNDGLNELKRYHAQHGDCLVPTRYSYEEYNLGRWVSRQRREYRMRNQGKPSFMTNDRVAALNELGFEWNVHQAKTGRGHINSKKAHILDKDENTWMEYMGQLKQYKQEHGDCNVSPNKDASSSNSDLAKWVKRQQRQYKLKGEGKPSKLTDENVVMLEQIGFEWEVSKGTGRRTWEEWLQMLAQYKSEHGDCDVPIKYGPLGEWAARQRRQYRQRNKQGKNNTSNLTDEKIAALEELGFRFVVPRHHHALWNERLNELKLYKSKHGNCLVPYTKRGDDTYAQLGNWVKHQRQQYKFHKQGKSSTMTNERIAALDELGFEWAVYSTQPIKKRTSAADKKKHGDSRPVPASRENTSLANWVDKQRPEHNQWKAGNPSSMTVERIDALSDREFGWDVSRTDIKVRQALGSDWDPEDPLGWTNQFGRRSVKAQERLVSLFQLKPNDRGYFDVSGIKVPNVSIVRTKDLAHVVLEKLMNSDPATFHACDVKVVDINLKKEGPVGNGYVACMSVYSGPTFDYGLGDGPGQVLWIDNLDDSFGLVGEFKTWLEDDRHLKVWHNYGFGRNLLWNEGIDCRGFGGDTMHMARIQNTARASFGNRAGYSLDGLMSGLVGRRKPSVKETFGVTVVRKDERGNETASTIIPPLEVMQRDPRFRAKWIQHSCFDAEGIWLIRNELQRELEKMPWVSNQNMYDYYSFHMKPFAVVLTDMERRGIRLDKANLMSRVTDELQRDRRKHVIEFRKWASSQIGPHGWIVNPDDPKQLRALLFGDPGTETSIDVPHGEIPFEDMHEEHDHAALEELGFESAPQAPIERRLWARQSDEFFPVVVTCVGMTPEKLDSQGEPSVGVDVLKKLAGNPFREKYGSAYEFFGGGKEGHDACVAFYHLCEVDVIDRHKTSFWTHLESLADDQSRVHCSINLNTETGRVSSRRPALENQPAHLIRKAFHASPGNNLVVADFRQLDLRLLACMADCKSMISLFVDGGDFHSRTAFDLFDHVKKHVNDGLSLLEWDSSKRESSKPILGDVFAHERQVAKYLNFAIIAGESSGAVSRKLRAPEETVGELIKKWHALHPEILPWQNEKKEFVRNYGVARTVLGRYRHLPDTSGKKSPSVLDRAGITTPIEGGVADVAMLALLNLSDCDVLNRLGWVLLMQMNNEVLLEGPQETVEEACVEIERCMKKPWDMVLDNPAVPLEVDVSCTGQSWFDAK